MTAVQEATALKQQGNQAFKHQQWQEAVDFYTKAIEKYDKDASFFCNRAQVPCGRIFNEPCHD
jgi:serine/threonine-protein phosphatase 5